MGVIPSGQENHSGAEHLNFPGGELNVISLQSNISLKYILKYIFSLLNKMQFVLRRENIYFNT